MTRWEKKDSPKARSEGSGTDPRCHGCAQDPTVSGTDYIACIDAHAVSPRLQVDDPLYLARNRGARQVFARAHIWHSSRKALRIPCELLLDSGAGGSNHASDAFWNPL